MTSPHNFLIVGLGASAGGIQALREFFAHVPADSGLAYVVILHLSPDHDSQLASVLQSVAAIPVTQVTERVRVEPDHVYVVSPNQHLEMDDGQLNVSPNTLLEERRAPVDIFFRTLAESHGPHAVAVVLSGTGANGSMGIKRIKEKGGAAFVQNPREAQWNEMPRNSIATELVDEVLNVAEIPAHILAYRDSLGTVEIPPEAEARPADQQQALREIFTLLRVRTGHDFANYKRPTLLRRIERRINVRQLPDVSAYAAFMRDNLEETQALLKDLLISVTNFFRDHKAFETIERDVMPRLMQGKRSDEQIRIWVAACATGEEAYSLAMLCAERALGVVDAPKIQIFATDIDATAIATAREGLYTINDAADVSAERLRRFFAREGDAYRIRREIREMVLFAQHNVLKDPPFSRLDLASCRNMLIYLNQTAQERVMETFHFALNPGGYLFLGTSESVDGANDLYAPVSREHRIYQSRAVATRSYPVPEASPTLRVEPPRALESPALERRERISYGDLHGQLLEQYAPPSLVVNEEHDILHLSEQAGRYLQIGGGEPSQNLLRLIRPELRLELRTALYQATQRQTNVEVRDLEVRLDDRTEIINLRIRPVMGEGDPARGFILVLFEPSVGEKRAADSVALVDEPMARQLETELIRLKAQLRVSNEQHELQSEELKASNEELQALNEELRSAAEELETSKEELQSINEELITVNQELKVKIEETTLASNNLQNLINSTDIGTIFLDRSLRINLFSPAVRGIFNLLPNDIGRPLSDITNCLEYEGLLADAETVLDKLQTVEHEVRTTDDRIFSMRVLPYRTAEDRIQGVVVTFFDITQRKRAEKARFHLAAIVESSEDSMLTVDFDGTITSWNQAAEGLYGYPAGEAIGKPLTLLTLPTDLAEVLRNAEKIKASQQVEIYDTVRVNKDGREMNLEVVLSPVKDSSGTVIGVSTIARDVTEHRRAVERLRESEERMRLIIEGAKDYAIFTLDNELRVSSWNTGAQAIFGYAENEILGEPSDILFTPEDRERGAPEREVKNARETGRAVNERWHIRKDSSRFWGSGLVNPLLDEPGNQIGFVKIMRDLTEQRQAEEARHESEEKYRHFVGATSDVVYKMSADWREMQNLIGKEFIATTDAPREDWLEAYIPATDRRLVWETIEKALRMKSNFELEHRIIRLDGSIGWTFSRATMVLDEQGEIVEWLGAASDVTERKCAEAELSASEEKYRELFNSIDEGYCIVEMIFDAKQEPVDYRFLEANPAFYTQTGLEAAVGKTMREFAPAYEKFWFETYGEIALTGISARFEHQAEALKRWYDVYAFRTGAPGERKVAVIFNDITERKRADERREFLLEFSDALRSLENPLEIQQVGMRLLGEHLNATRAFYFLTESVVGGDWIHIIETDYRRDPAMPSHAGRHSVSNFGIGLFEGAERGKVVAVEDVTNVSLLTAAEIQNYLAVDIVAFINVPLIKGEKFVAGIGAHDSSPRLWKPEEIALIQEVAERTWAAVERAHAGAALRASEAQLAIELEGTKELQKVSSLFIEDEDSDALYGQLLDAAMTIMRADFGSVQIVDDERGELRLLAWRNFHPRSAEHWQRVSIANGTSCGAALRRGERIIVPDVREADFLEDTPDLRQYAQSGILAVQSTPLVMREGRIIGMISTHWRAVHAPDERELWLLDVLARQAADFFERRRAQAALRQSEETFSALVENAPFGVYLIDTEFRLRITNEGSRRVFSGIDPLIGRDFAEILRILWHEPFAAEATARFRHTLQTGASFISPPVIQARANIEEIESYDWQLHRVTMPDGSYGVVCYFYDLSEQKRLEETVRRAAAAARESEARFRTLTDAVPQVIWTNEAGGKANYFNSRWFEYSGLTLDESVGPGWQAMVHPDDAPASIESWNQALVAGAIFDTEYRLRRADGVYRWHIGRNVPLRDEAGNVLGWFGSATDIEDLKQTEAALRESEERFRALVEGSLDYAIFLMDAEGQILYWNSGAERIFGYTREQALGQNSSLLFTPEDQERGEPAKERQAAMRQGHTPDNRWHQRQDGRRFWAEGVLAALRGDDALRGFVKIARDASREREAEAALRQSHEELEARVTARTLEMAEINAILQAEVMQRTQVEQAREQLIERIVTTQEEERRRISRELHDQMGQQLTALLIGLKALGETPETKPRAPGQLAQLTALQSLTSDLMQEMHNLAWELRPAALDNLGLEPALSQYAQQWSQQYGIEADFVCRGLVNDMRLPAALEITLYRVLQEALTNVQRHSGATRVSVLLERQQNAIAAIVEDDGRGFSLETTSSGVPRPASHRLGLMGMQERMELVGGTLTIESAPGQGTTVYARAPLEQGY